MDILISNNSWQIFCIFFVFLSTLVLSMRVGRLFLVGDKLSLKIFLWHTFFCFIYFLYSLNSIADATLYFERSLIFEGFPKVGTDFIYFFTSLFSKYLGFSYLGVFLIYNFIGFLGVLALAGSLIKTNIYNHKNKKILFYLLVFLPTLSFWSVAIGKDVFSFLAVCLSIWAVVERTKFSILVIAIVLMLLVRPHIAAIMLVAFMISVIFSKDVNSFIKILSLGIGIGVTAILIPFALNYAGLDDWNSVGDVQDYIDQRQSYNLEGSSSVDISSMSLPMQLLTYLIRPLPFEAHSIFALISSLDNIIILILLIVGIYRGIKRYKPIIYSNRVYLWSYFLITWFLLSVTTANLGIAMRQKWMFLPVIFFLIFSIFYEKYSEIENRRGKEK